MPTAFAPPCRMVETPRKTRNNEEGEPAPEKRAVRKRWAELIYKIYEVDPLTCRCGAQMKIVAFVTEPASICRILAHRNNNTSGQRAPNVCHS